MQLNLLKACHLVYGFDMIWRKREVIWNDRHWRNWRRGIRAHGGNLLSYGVPGRRGKHISQKICLRKRIIQNSIFMWISNWKMRSAASVMRVQIRKRSLNIFHFAKEGKLTAGYCWYLMRCRSVRISSHRWNITVRITGRFRSLRQIPWWEYVWQDPERWKHDDRGFLFPAGKINQITLYPMTIEKYLMNLNPIMYEMIWKTPDAKEPLSSEIHQLVMEQVYRYLLIGRMPEALDLYIDSGDALETREIQKDLYVNYLSGMELYQASPESVLRSRSLFQNIYRELSRETKNFSPGLIEQEILRLQFSGWQWRILSISHSSWKNVLHSRW